MAYQFADIKTLFMDIDCGVRGLGGCKQPFNYKSLPSYDKYNKNNEIIPENETEEERLIRHKRFFESLKNIVKSDKLKD